MGGIVFIFMFIFPALPMDAAVYTNEVETEIFKVGFCLPAGPYVSDDDVRYIASCIKEAIVSR